MSSPTQLHPRIDRVVITGLLVLAVLACSRHAAPDLTEPVELPAAVEEQIRLRMNQGHHMATVIGIVDRLGTRYYGFGRVSPDSAESPDEHSIFEIGSITKTFTGTLLADMDRRGEVSLDDSIGDRLRTPGEPATLDDWSATLGDLLTHTSGLPREPTNLDPDRDDRYAHYSTTELTQFLSGFSPTILETPEYSYSNLGVLVLEHAIESSLGRDYESLVLERITTELDMSDTLFEISPAKEPRLVVGSRAGQPTEALDLGEFQSMGGLRSTAADMLRYLAAQVGLLPSRLDQAMQRTRELRFSNGETALGLGWFLLESKTSGKLLHYHKGGTNGFVSFAGFNLEDQIGVVVLISGRRWFSDLGFHLLDPTYPLSSPD